MADALTASLEDYLETIHHLIDDDGVARVKDIARRMKVKAASVTGALRTLAGQGFVNYRPYEAVTLTERGDRVAHDIIRRHEVLKNFFVNVLAVDGKTAEESACRMEHAVAPVIIDRLVEFADFTAVCPRGGEKWIRGFSHTCERNRSLDECEQCVEQCLDDVRRKKKELNGMLVNLKECARGDRVKVVKVDAAGAVKKRIVEMGITPGAVVEVDKVAPLGDPVDVRVRGYHLTLRKEELDGILVQTVG